MNPGDRHSSIRGLNRPPRPATVRSSSQGSPDRPRLSSDPALLLRQQRRTILRAALRPYGIAGPKTLKDFAPMTAGYSRKIWTGRLLMSPEIADFFIQKTGGRLTPAVLRPLVNGLSS